VRPTPYPTSTLPIPSYKFEPIIKENVLFDFSECGLANGSVTCKFKITNKGADEKFRFYGRPLMFDDKGTEYMCKSAQIKNSSREIPLLKDVEVEAIMTFDGVNKDISYVRKLVARFGVRSPNRILDVELTYIALSKKE
jgi:hypothetical protein